MTLCVVRQTITTHCVAEMCPRWCTYGTLAKEKQEEVDNRQEWDGVIVIAGGQPPSYSCVHEGLYMRGS